MGHGVVTPELRGPTARRLLAQEEKDHAHTKRLLASAEGTITTLHGMREEVAKAMAVANEQIEALQKENASLAKDADAAPYLMDMIAEYRSVIAQYAALTAKEAREEE